MQKNKYTDGNRIIYATEKAFHTLYREKGFYLCEEANKHATAKKSRTNSSGNSKPNRKSITRKSASDK